LRFGLCTVRPLDEFNVRLLVLAGRDFNAGDAAGICPMSDVRCPMSALPLAAEAPSLIKQKTGFVAKSMKELSW